MVCKSTPASPALLAMLAWLLPTTHNILQPMDAPNPTPLPDPWLFDSEALLRELDRCREIVLQIPITNANATHFGIQLAVNAIWNLTENLRYLLHMHREKQRSIRRQHEKSLSSALAKNAATHKSNIVRLSTPAPSNSARHSQTPRERFAKRRRAQSPAA